MKKRTKSQLRKEADRVCSIYIRLRDRDQLGFTQCFTCPWKGDMKRAQCGHFVPRQHLATRYLEENLAAQCFACNMYYNGQPSKFAIGLMKKYGGKIIRKLEGMRLQICHDFDYQGIIDYYTSKLEEMGMGYLL